MTLCSEQCYLLLLLTVVASALDVSELNVDSSLNPRLLGAVYHLYKPTDPKKETPIIVDCSHPNVVCRFGSSMLITENKECNCKDSSDKIPIITGLTAPEKENTDKLVTDKEGSIVSTEDKEPVVPIFKGIVDTNKILAERERPYNIWNFQRNSVEKGWRPSEDTVKMRVGELPGRYYSYYPFSKPPKLPDFSEEDDEDDHFPEFPFDMSDDSRYVMWRKPSSSYDSNNFRSVPTSKPKKITPDKLTTTMLPSTVLPQRKA